MAALPAGCGGDASAADTGETACANAHAVGVCVTDVVLELAGRWNARTVWVCSVTGILGLAGWRYARAIGRRVGT